MTALPAPLVPAEVDLRDFAFMPLDVVRLRDSGLAAKATGDEFRAAVLLWCASWHQPPAASLPDDDQELANLCGYGRAPREWKKVREGALRGWVLCEDGRLYHPIVAGKALEAWTAKLAQRARTEAARKAREEARQRQSQSLSQTGEPSVTDPVAVVVTESKGQGQGLRNPSVPSERAVAPPPKPAEVIFANGLPLLTAAGVSEKGARSMLGLMRKQHGDEAVAQVLQRCAEAGPIEPVAWLQAALKAKIAAKEAVKSPAWHAAGA